MSDEGFVSEADYQNHRPWCRARRFGRLNADACNCDLKRDPLHGIPAVIGTSEDFPLTHRPGEYMGQPRNGRPPSDERFIVAEVSKTWVNGRSLTDGQPRSHEVLAQLFERVINTNHARGYRLHSFQLHQLMTSRADDLNDQLVETIIAVFERT